MVTLNVNKGDFADFPGPVEASDHLKSPVRCFREVCRVQNVAKHRFPGAPHHQSSFTSCFLLFAHFHTNQNTGNSERCNTSDAVPPINISFTMFRPLLPTII